MDSYEQTTDPKCKSATIYLDNLGGATLIISDIKNGISDVSGFV